MAAAPSPYCPRRRSSVQDGAPSLPTCGVRRLHDVLCLAGTDALLLFPCSISNFTPKVGEKDTQRAIRQAFNVWQTVTPLSFQVGFMCGDFLLLCIRSHVTVTRQQVAGQ